MVVDNNFWGSTYIRARVRIVGLYVCRNRNAIEVAYSQEDG